MQFDKGQGVRLIAKITDMNGRAADPTTVTLRLKAPGGQPTTPAVVKDSKGSYHYDLTLDVVGTWYYRWEAMGSVVAAEEATITVRATQF